MLKIREKTMRRKIFLGGFFFYSDFFAQKMRAKVGILLRLNLDYLSDNNETPSA